MWALRDRLNDAMSCDSLTFGGNAFQSLLAKNVKVKDLKMEWFKEEIGGGFVSVNI